eukprot:3708003-Amphidinium_carterae.2
MAPMYSATRPLSHHWCLDILCAHLHDNFVYFPGSQSDPELDMVAELAFTMGGTTERDIGKNSEIDGIGDGGERTRALMRSKN